MREALCQAFCDSLLIREVRAGLAVSTAFVSRSGDRVGFYIKRQQSGLSRIEDGGITLPGLEADGLDFATPGTRREAMEALLAEYGVNLDKDGRAFAIDDLTEDELPKAAMRFVAFSLRVLDFELMTEARIVSTFREDVRRLLGSAVDARAKITEGEAITPNLQDFPADFVLRAPNRDPVGVYLATGDSQVLQALWVQMKAQHETHDRCSIIAMLERNNSVTMRVRQQAMNRLKAVTMFRGDEIASVERIAREALGNGSASLH